MTRTSAKQTNHPAISRALITSSLVLAVSPLVATAQSSDTLEEMVVEGQHLEESIPTDLAQYGNQIAVITSEDIKAQGYADISEALSAMVPGLHVMTSGPFDYIDASLQGSRISEILWLVDGVRITNRLYNGTSPLDTLPTHMVERVEVLKGGQGIFYGTQSVGGVVNIVTKSFANETNGEVGIGTNTNGGVSINALARGASGAHQYVVYASKDESDGYQPYSDQDFQPSSTDRDRGYDVQNLGLKYAFNVNNSARLSLQAHLTNAELDYARAALNNNTVNDREERIYSAKYDWAVNDQLDLYIKAYQHTWDTYYTRVYNLLDDEGNLTGEVDVRNDQTYWGYEDYGVNALAKLRTDHGLEYVLGFDQQNFSAEDAVWRIADQEETVNAPFVQIRTTDDLIDNAAFAFGVRNNRPSNSEAVTVWNLSGRVELTSQLYVQGNLGTSFRLPDAEALFLNEYYDDDNDGVPDYGWFAIGNPDLDPEKSQNLNLSIGGEFERMRFELTGFTRDITNYIESYVPIEINGVVGETFVNTDDEVNVDGFEFTSDFNLTDQVSGGFTHTHTLARENDSGAQMTDIPRNETKANLAYQFANAPAGITLNANYVGEIIGRYSLVRGHYTTFDVSGFYRLGNNEQHLLTLRVQNLSDKEYTTSYGTATADSSGESYVYSRLGVPRTLHASYTYQF